MNEKGTFLAVSLLAIFFLAYGMQTTSAAYSPVINPANFVRHVSNPYLPMKPGTRYTFTGIMEASKLLNVMTITYKTKMIMGVNCTVVLDIVYIDGIREEQTIDWYAQDKTGNVWYFGEDSKEYDPITQKVISTEGSWIAGVNGSLPGIVMEAHPKAGDTYRQEFAKGIAEDMARVVTNDTDVVTRLGYFEEVVKIKEWSPLMPGVVEVKYYAPGFGLVFQNMTKGGLETTQLVRIEAV